MPRLLCNWVLMALSFAISAEAVATDQCQGLKFVQVQNLSLKDFGRLAQQTVTSGATGAVAYIPFDEEDYPIRDKFRALGVVFARVGDIGETPIGGYVWISNDAGFKGYSVTKKADSISITFNVAAGQHCSTSQLTVELKQMGRVYVNGAFIGAIK